MTTDSLSEQTLVRAALEGLFSGDQRAAAHSLAAQARFETVGEGQVLMAEGAAADDLFVLCAGRLHVYGRDGSGALGLVASIEQAGQVVGEQAFIDDRKFRNATLAGTARTPASAAQRIQRRFYHSKYEFGDRGTRHGHGARRSDRNGLTCSGAEGSIRR